VRFPFVVAAADDDDDHDHDHDVIVYLLILLLLLLSARVGRVTVGRGCRYEDSAFWIRQFTSILAINCIITWMKMLKFCKNVPAMTHIINVITHCLPLMANFMLLFLVIFSGFAFAHLLAYGDTIGRFKDATSAFYSMYRVIVGDFDFMEMYLNNRIIGPAFLLLWTMIGLTVLFNVFVAILMESYEATKTEDVGFVDMVTENLMKPLVAKMDKMLKMFKKESGAEDEVQQGEIDGESRQQSVPQPDASRRLQRKKAAAKETEVRSAVAEMCLWYAELQ
jgi:hypothetical protein